MKKRLLTLGDLRREINGQPLALDKSALDAVTASCNAQEFRAGIMEELAAQREEPVLRVENGVGCINVEGIIVKRPSLLQAVMGGVCQLCDLEELLHQAATQPLTALVLRIDSPGGTLAGVPEMASRLYELKGKSTFPIIACVEGMAASAAYWLASQCDEVCVSEASSVGSIGVVCVSQDDTRALQNMGVDVRTFATDSRKTGNGPEADRSMQARIDRFTAMFRQAVTRGRNLTEAQVAALPSTELFTGADAVKCGLADEVGTFDNVWSRYAK
jgi:signal peptide peptidase SppA